MSTYNELIKLQTDAKNAYQNMQLSKKIFIKKLGTKINEAIAISEQTGELQPLILTKEYFNKIWPKLWEYYALGLERDGWIFRDGLVVPPDEKK